MVMDKRTRILLVRTDRIGDLTLTTPAISALREKYPDAHISVLTSSYARDVLKNNSDLDEIITENGFFHTLGEIRSGKFDVAVIIFLNLKVALLVFLAGIKLRIGPASKIWSVFLNKPVFQHRSRMEKHEADYNLELLEVLGVNTRRRKSRITLTAEEKGGSAEILNKLGLKKEDFIAGIHPGSNGSALNWPEENFAGLADKLLKEFNIKVLLTGSAAEIPLLKKISSLMTEKAFILREPMPLRQFIGAISFCRIFITNSTGPLHLASALGIPTLSFFPPIRGCSPVRWGPYGDGMNIVLSPGGKDCLRCEKNSCTRYNCMNEVTVDNAFKAAGKMLNSLNLRPIKPECPDIPAAKGPFTIFHLDDGRELRGGQGQLLNLAKELSALGHKNIIICRKNSPLSGEAARLKLKTFFLPYFFEWDPVSALILRHKIKTGLKNQALPAILHSHTSHTAAHSWLAGLGLNCVRIVHRRVDFTSCRGISTDLKYARADRVIAISRAVREMLIKAGLPPDKIAMVNSSIDLSAAPWRKTGFEAYRKNSREKISALFGIKKDAFWTGSLIALVPHKDPLNFVRAAKEVLSVKPDTHFLLAGKGRLRGRAQKLAKTLGLENNFHFLGYYPEPYEILSALDLFVLSSREEGMGSVLLEAMHAGVPIAATAAGGITDVIENEKNGLLAPREDPPALAMAQLRIMNDPELAKSLAAEGRRRLAYFSSVKMAERTLKIYEEAVENFKPD
ncbi:MAG: glycosyltransferase [Elusimicrobia bacterium]|nr:glycosyltransferase [Elusimicrobiota bacterium]